MALKPGDIRLVGWSSGGNALWERIKTVRKSGGKTLYTTSFPFKLGRKK